MKKTKRLQQQIDALRKLKQQSDADAVAAREAGDEQKAAEFEAVSADFERRLEKRKTHYNR